MEKEQMTRKQPNQFTESNWDRRVIMLLAHVEENKFLSAQSTNRTGPPDVPFV